jgi:hypothetical protein
MVLFCLNYNSLKIKRCLVITELMKYSPNSDAVMLLQSHPGGIYLHYNPLKTKRRLVITELMNYHPNSDAVLSL